MGAKIEAVADAGSLARSEVGWRRGKKLDVDVTLKIDAAEYDVHAAMWIGPDGKWDACGVEDEHWLDRKTVSRLRAMDETTREEAIDAIRCAAIEAAEQTC